MLSTVINRLLRSLAKCMTEKFDTRSDGQQPPPLLFPGQTNAHVPRYQGNHEPHLCATGIQCEADSTNALAFSPRNDLIVNHVGQILTFRARVHSSSSYVNKLRKASMIFQA